MVDRKDRRGAGDFASSVRVHIASIVRKLGVPNRGAAVELFGRRSDT